MSAARDANAAARDAALAAVAGLAVTPSTLVDYRSQGRLLIVGPLAALRAADALLAACDDGAARRARVSLLATDATDDTDAAGADDDRLLYSRGRALSLSGHLGAFRLQLAAHGDAPALNLADALSPPQPGFDLVLDLQPVPLLERALPPFGYRALAPDADTDSLRAALDQLCELTGEFEKPKYFLYDPSICAHGRSGVAGCRRCLDACPAGAITSLAERIDVDPHLCQGGGICATACPSGAIVYAYPQPADTLDRLRALLRGYRDAGGADPVLLLYGGEDAAPRSLPAQVLAVELEELASVGIEVWLGALAYGARRVLLLETTPLADGVGRELGAQLATARALLVALGYPPAALTLTDRDALAAAPGLALAGADNALPATLSPAGFAGSNDKRAALLFAIDWLYEQALRAGAAPPQQTGLPDGAPFGEVQVDRDACTLCMGCVSVCPAAALEAGGDTPRLSFIEANCLQCGLCRRACPESAITLAPRLLFDRERRRARRTLHQETPFHCIGCGKAFATRSVIDKMQSKLAGHAMFQDPAALRRLQMCGDCRVRDLLQAER